MATTFDDTSEPLPQRLAGALARLSIALRSQAVHEGGARGLSPTQAQILTVLRARGPLKLREVAEALSVTAATASDSVAALVGKGLARKAKDPSDARAMRLELTAKGTREAEVAAQWPDFLLAAIDTLDESEQEVFLRAVVKMIRTLQVRGHMPVSRACVTCKHFRPHVHDDAREPHHCDLVGAPFGDRHLRIDCAEHAQAPDDVAELTFIRFLRKH